MRQAFEERRNYIVERMNAIPGVSCIKPEGAFYVMMNLEQLIGKTIHGVEITNDDVFADAFLKYGLVAVVPGSGFAAPNFVRWSYATSMENIKEGLDRLEKFLAGNREIQLAAGACPRRSDCRETPSPARKPRPPGACTSRRCAFCGIPVALECSR